MRVVSTLHQGYICWMFFPDENLDKSSQRPQLAQLKKLCRERLGRSHGSLAISMWTALHRSRYDGIAVSSWTHAIFIRDKDVAVEAMFMFC